MVRCGRANITQVAPHAAAAGFTGLLARTGGIDEAESLLADVGERFPTPTHRVALVLHGKPQDLAAAADLFEAAERAMEQAINVGDRGHARELVSLWVAHRGREEDAAVLALREVNEVRHIRATLETAAWAPHQAGRDGEAEAIMRRASDRTGSVANTILRKSGAAPVRA